MSVSPTTILTSSAPKSGGSHSGRIMPSMSKLRRQPILKEKLGVSSQFTLILEKRYGFFGTYNVGEQHTIMTPMCKWIEFGHGRPEREYLQMMVELSHASLGRTPMLPARAGIQGKGHVRKIISNLGPGPISTPILPGNMLKDKR